MKTRYITDEKGKATSVILSIREYKRICDALEELEDIRLYDKVKAKNEERVTLNELLEQRKKGRRAW